jgi:hypothetical protein
MVMYRFLHIGFSFPGVPKMRDLEPVISTIGDWVRYSALSWIVWTDRPTGEVFLTIRQYLDPQDQIFIVKIDPLDSFGSIGPWFWSWINSKTPSPSVRSGDDLANLLGLPKLKK